MFNNMDDVANPSPWKNQYQGYYYVYPWTMPSDVPLGPLDTNVVSGHLIFQYHKLQLTIYPDIWMAI